ncbi:MAG TPA: hypothetical protein VIS10_02315 [Anaerolineales bacterium]
MKRKSPPSNEFDGYHSVNPLKRVEIRSWRDSPFSTGLNIPSRAFQRLADAKKSSPSNKFDG